MSSVYDRMLRSNPALKSLAPVIEALITAVNKLSSVIFTGNNPHKENDVANTVTTGDAGNLDEVADLEKALNTAYVAHIASGTYHIAADSTNTLTATTVYAKVKALVDNLRTKYEAHRVYTTGTTHAGADSTNVAGVTVISTKATAITVLNDLKAVYNAHIINVSTCHGAADTTNTVILTDLGVSATWSEIQAMADSIRAKYEAHRVLTSGSVHGGADATNSATVAAVGSVQTSVDTYLTELKGDFNAHIILASSHAAKDESMQVTVANATTLATSIALANAIKSSFNDHITRADEAALTVDSLFDI